MRNTLILTTHLDNQVLTGWIKLKKVIKGSKWVYIYDLEIVNKKLIECGREINLIWKTLGNSFDYLWVSKTTFKLFLGKFHV